MIVQSLQNLIGQVPIQFDPILYIIAAQFLLFLTSFFANFIKHIMLRR